MIQIRSEIQKLFVKEKSSDLKLLYEEFLGSINLVIGFGQLFLTVLNELENIFGEYT